MKIYFTLLLLSLSLVYSQDTISYPWPVKPFNETKEITGTFCEFRPTGSSPHFHNGTDIPFPDNGNVYPVFSGQVTGRGTDGSNSYVRVQSSVNGVTKSIAYVHINPLVVVGDIVTAGVTVVGTIYPGQGHVHLIDGEFNSEINALRDRGGVSPYIDPWSPNIISVKFFQDNSPIEFTTKKVFGLVDIVAELAEVNGTSSANRMNNGIHEAGYKIYSYDSSTVSYTPPANGVRFKFDWKPNDGHSTVVYTSQSSESKHVYYLTNGAGNIGVSRLQGVANNSFNSTTLPAGQYQVMVYAKDTHGNADTVFAPFEISTQDVVAPANPILKAVRNDSTNRVTISWYANTEPDLKGYRLYSSVNGTTWMLQKNEFTLTRNMTSYSFNGITSATPVYFRLTAVDSAAITNESGLSDTYGLRPNLAGHTVLIVDAFDRTGGSYKQLYHPFAMTAGQSVPTRFETAHNKAVTDGSVSLSGYHAVVWLFGDESSTDETFGAAEQAKTMAYLKAGGKLFVSGSEVAYDLDRDSGPSQSDRDFFNLFLKSDYAGDASSSYTVSGTGPMTGVSFGYGDTLQGAPYREDYPDYITAAGGSTITATYGNGLGAMTAFSGTFTDGTAPGAVVLLALPFETIHTKAHRDSVMKKVLNYFGITTSIAEHIDGIIPASIALEQNYPNPFNPATTIKFSLSPMLSGKNVRLEIYTVLGEKIATLVDEELAPGKYSVRWDGSAFASGMYFYRLQAGGYSETKKLMLMK